MKIAGLVLQLEKKGFLRKVNMASTLDHFIAY